MKKNKTKEKKSRPHQMRMLEQFVGAGFAVVFISRLVGLTIRRQSETK